VALQCGQLTFIDVRIASKSYLLRRGMAESLATQLRRKIGSRKKKALPKQGKGEATIESEELRPKLFANYASDTEQSASKQAEGAWFGS
jgi:hypothetical protein